MTQDNNSLEALIAANGKGLKTGNDVSTADSSVAATASVPLYVDANKKLAAGGYPFAVPMIAGTIDTSFSAMSVSGASTLSADEIMHQTLVAGAGVTTFTKTGFIRVTITDSSGNITSGAHYIQVGTLS